MSNPIQKNSKISGISIVRNAQILNYPFQESVRSVLPLCDEFLINCGRSDDETLKLCLALKNEAPEKIKIIETIWGAHKKEAGLELSGQTNAMVEKAVGDWCFYVQADEVVHEDDLNIIRTQINLADTNDGIDGIVFDYLHFYTSYDYQIEGRNWYRREVRAFKKNRSIESVVDAQGFRRQGKKLKVLPAKARIFHYGYVRTPELMKKKSIEMAKWWGNTPEIDVEKMQPVNHVGLKKFQNAHPKVMEDKIRRENFPFRPSEYARRWNKQEVKNLLNVLSEKFLGVRLGEFKNYELMDSYSLSKKQL